VATPNQFLRIPSTRKLFVLLTLILLLANVPVVNAQVNTNSANGNNNNANVNTSLNANRNGNANADTNANNANASVNQNGNANANSNQANSGTATDLGDQTKSWIFFFLLFLLFAGVIAPFVYAITRAILFSKGTFNNPLGLPDGSLRAMLAFTLVAFLGFYVYANILNPNLKVPEFLLGIVATVVGFYFGSRTTEAGSTAPRRTGTLAGTVKDKNETPAAGASVELSQSGVQKFTQTADLSGKFTFDNIPVGDYDIKASLAGQTSDPVKVKVTTDPAQPVNLKLK
jgi:hypothetical protein